MRPDDYDEGFGHHDPHEFGGVDGHDPLVGRKGARPAPPTVTRTAVVTITDDSLWPFSQSEFEAILEAFLFARFQGKSSSVTGTDVLGMTA